MKGWALIAAALLCSCAASAQAVRDYKPLEALKLCERSAQSDKASCLNSALEQTALAVNWYRTELADFYRGQASRRDGAWNNRKARYDEAVIALNTSLNGFVNMADANCFFVALKEPQPIKDTVPYLTCQVTQWAGFLASMKAAHQRR